MGLTLELRIRDFMLNKKSRTHIIATLQGSYDVC